MKHAYKVFVSGIQMSFPKESYEEEAFRAFLYDLVKVGQDKMITAELYFENYILAFCHFPNQDTVLECAYYNDFDDYEDEILIGSEKWMHMFSNKGKEH